MSLFSGCRKANPKIHRELQGAPKSKKVFIKKNKVGGFVLPNIKTYYKATVIKRMLYWHKEKHID
jgi:hypothetical protein